MFDCFVVLFIFCSILVPAFAANQINITIPLNKTIKYNTELYGNFFYVNRSSRLYVNFENVNSKVSFIIFQVHSHLHKVNVYNNSLASKTAIYGTNVGYYAPVTSLDTYYVVNSNTNVDLKLYISVHGYTTKDPIPGGCNLVYNGDEYPSMMLEDNLSYTNIDIAMPRRANDTNCYQALSPSLITKFRAMYFKERNFNAETYFDAIRFIMKKENLKNTYEIMEVRLYGKLRRTVSAYPGTGIVYMAITRDLSTGGFSMYIPTYSYACSPLEKDSCELIGDIWSQFACTSLLFIGIFLCYFGHRFFKTEMFLMGFISGGILTYIIISLMAEISSSALVTASVMSGVCFGSIWLMLWWLYAIPLVSVMLPSLNLGFLISAICYYRIVDNDIDFHFDPTFWSLIAVIIIVTAVILMTVSLYANILCCSVIGAYMTVFSIDYYLGSNLKYILINILRRATVPDFRYVVLIPPFESVEKMVMSVWIIMAMTGAAYQYYYSQGRPPFPPPPRSTRPGPPNYGTLAQPRSRLSSAVSAVGDRNSTSDEQRPLLQ